ncbi:hypothetical protein [Caballeronia sp. GAWG1-5s-s]|uniref:hypothetical protein n=1 Tax=Caballeronia sp. GAWG1-5s-s TaxID=2921743 RepID=UPI0020294340|nr:hypothetical protein [Caballeronia sp. GAWG1-5s-s]
MLYIDEVTPEKATLLAREADHQSADILIFIDNAADATDAINILSRCRKVKIIAAERDYYFDIVSHKFNKSEFTILDVSGLADSDIQEIQNLIPTDVSRRDFRRDLGDLDSQEQPTIFEFFIKTIIDNSLIERFLAALKELKSTDLLKHDLLIAACYLYNCRVPMSLDVAAAFSSSYSVNAIEAKNILDGVGSLLSPYEGALAELRENYYVPRSRSIAETVLQKVAGNDLRRVFDNFHNYVSPTKITRYDIFKRSAYDARLMKRAYPNFRDGIEFYESAFTRDPSHYLKQQGALYLSDRGQTELAFSWIDQARSMAGKNNPTIRNSYAVILFDANYSKPVDADVVATLNESMQILDDCYNYDKRKAYHAKVFAEQALSFYEKVPDEPNIKSYLVKAQKWIDAERTQRKSARWMNPLNRKLSAALRSL